MQKKYLLMLAVLLFSALSTSAQSVLGNNAEEQYKSEVRDRLALDYSMPDYSVKKIDEHTIGPRLAKILLCFVEQYKESFNNQILARIRSEKAGKPNLQYIKVEKLKLLKISKTGNKITVLINTFTKDQLQGKLDYDIDLTFVDGSSENKNVNDLFCNIARYVQE